MILEQGTFKTFDPQKEIVIAYGKASGYSTTDVNELMAIYHREIRSKLADFGFNPPANTCILRLSVLSDLADVAQKHGKNFTLWLMPRVEESQVFILMADNLTEATGALKCWANMEGFDEWKKDIPWREITKLLWQQD